MNFFAAMFQVVGVLEGHLSLGGPMWSDLKGNTRQL